MAENLVITIGADASQIQAELQIATNKLRDLETQLKKTSDVNVAKELNNQIQSVRTNIQQLQTSVAAANNALTTRLVPGANQAGTAVGNMSRIVQDAPYGFIAISNNLQPLFDDFGRLRAETGSAGGALKALGGSLMGPAGIGFAFAAITSLITVFTMNMGKAKDQMSETEKEAKRFAEGLDSAKASAMSTGIQLQAYVDIARNGQLPLEQRNEALKKANEILGEHGEKLTLTNIATEKVTQQVELYTKALIAQSIVAKYTDRIAELSIKKQSIKEKLNAQEIKSIKAQKFYDENYSKSTLRQQQIMKQYALQQKQSLFSFLGELGRAEKEIETMSANMKAVIGESTLAFSQLGTKSEEKTKKIEKSTKKDIETIDEFYAKYKENIADLARVEAATSESKLPEKLKTTVSALEGIISQFNLDPDNKFVIAIKSDLFRLQLQETFSKPLNLPPIQMALAVDPKKFTPILSDTYKKATKVLQKENEGLQKQMQANADAINNILKGTFEGIASSVAEGFANLMMGGNVADFFKGIFGTIAEGMIQLGKQFIQMAIQISIVKKFLLKNPALAIAGGVALIAIGSVLKSLMGKKSAFATGTTFAPGGLALVGERGPELIGLPRGSQVIPATQTANMMGAMESVQVYGVLRGQDIYFSNKKYQQTYNRTA